MVLLFVVLTLKNAKWLKNLAGAHSEECGSASTTHRPIFDLRLPVMIMMGAYLHIYIFTYLHICIFTYLHICSPRVIIVMVAFVLEGMIMIRSCQKNIYALGCFFLSVMMIIL